MGRSWSPQETMDSMKNCGTENNKRTLFEDCSFFRGAFPGNVFLHVRHACCHDKMTVNFLFAKHFEDVHVAHVVHPFWVLSARKCTTEPARARETSDLHETPRNYSAFCPVEFRGGSWRFVESTAFHGGQTNGSTRFHGVHEKSWRPKRTHP